MYPKSEAASTNIDAIASAVQAGVHSGFKALMEDSESVEKFWRGGFEELTKHASTGASQWVGKRILAAIVMAIVAWLVTWLVRTGGLK